MEYITVKEILEAYIKREEDTPCCPSCLSVLEEIEDDNGRFLICPNEMCLDNTEYRLS